MRNLWFKLIAQIVHSCKLTHKTPKSCNMTNTETKMSRVEDFITSLNDEEIFVFTELMVPHADWLRGLRRKMIECFFLNATTSFFLRCHLISSTERESRSRNTAVPTPPWGFSHFPGCPLRMFQLFYYLFWVFKQTVTHSVQMLGLKSVNLNYELTERDCSHRLNTSVQNETRNHRDLIRSPVKNTKPRPVSTTWL